LVITLVLTFLGLLAVADVSAPQAQKLFEDRFYFVKQQAVWGLIGLISLFITSKIHYSFWKKISTPLFFLSLALLVLVLVPGMGVKLLGARRWLVLGPISFQPAEITKLCLCLYLANVATRSKKALKFLIPLGIIFILIMAQPDLGTTLVIFGIGIIQTFLSGVSIFSIIKGVISGSLLAYVAIITSAYRKERLLVFLESTKDPLGRSYHIRQILLALGSGGLFGLGIGRSRQKHLFLPEVATDSVFAVIAEEVGFIGATLVIILIAMFVYKGLKIASSAPDKFSHIAASGIVAWIGGQALMNIGAMVAFIPLTGIPLPFFSYGGSSLTMTLLATGILLNISRYKKLQRK
jgi:cell division protein FtsW